MSLTKFKFSPLVDGYSLKPAVNTLYVMTAGGAPRKRLAHLNGWDSLSVTWMFNGDGFRYWKAFYQSVIKYASLNFLLDLQVNDVELQEHEVCISPDSITESQFDANLFKVSCTLFVKQRANTLGADFVDAMNAFGDVPTILSGEDQLQVIVNTEIPNDIL